MKFFRKKDKQKNATQGKIPSFGPGTDLAGDGFFGFGANASSGQARPSPGPGSDSGRFHPLPTQRSPMILATFPETVLRRILVQVCPHSQDESYDTCEESAMDDACMLCDLRDLAHCVAVCKAWRKEGLKLLYHSIRIDPVHYCEREGILSERRKRRSRFDRNGESEDTSKARLKLLCRTLREDPVRLGRTVEFLKMPYMLRESSQVDLARTIAVTPNLRYVDLPDGLFTDDPSFVTLRLEVQARCLELRKMTYMGGSERSLQALATGTVWAKLEVLELIRVNLDPAMLRQVLGCLGNLRALKITDTAYVNDQTLAWSDMLPPFPALEEFILNDVPNVTAEGLKAWLVMPAAREALRVMTVNNTGVQVWALHEVIAQTPNLKHLSIMNSVTGAMPATVGPQAIPPLSSRSLETLHYEITAGPSSPKFSGVTSGYYHYLAGSLLSGGLPNLRAVYVRDPDFPDVLLGLPPPAPSYVDGGIARPASSGSNTPFSPRYSTNNSLSPGFSSNTPPHGPFPGGPSTFSPSQQNPFSTPPRAGSGSPQNFTPGHNPRFSSNNPFAPMVGMAGGSVANLPAKLEVFTKGDDEIGWSFVSFKSGSASRRGNAGRPLSSYGLGADILGGSATGWSSGSGARRSVLVGGAGGGFLAVPGSDGGNGARGRGSGSGLGGGSPGGEDFWPRPLSSSGETKREKMDLWR